MYLYCFRLKSRGASDCWHQPCFRGVLGPLNMTDVILKWRFRTRWKTCLLKISSVAQGQAYCWAKPKRLV